jgi:GTP pyrophosphokinase
MCWSDTTKIAPVYDLFFAPLEVAFDPNTIERINFAYFQSKFGHYDQKRDDGSRYFDHPKGAAWIYINEFDGRDPRLIIDLLLHDISEDAYLLSSYRICVNFGEEIALDVRAVTKLPKGKEMTQAYLHRIITRGTWAITAKLFDRLHNLRTLDASSEEKRTRQIIETKEFHLPLLIPALRGYGGQWAEYANGLEKKINEALESIK